MTGVVKDSFVDLERHRLQLEQNVNKLRASLQHWRTWEIEYEGMKEDILALANNSSPTDLESVGNDAEYSLLNAKERRLLLRDENGNLRQSQQVLGLLSRRVDYVQQNIKSVSSLLQVAEGKYVASQILSQPEVRNEEGLPLTEIQEELDEEGNVICTFNEDNMSAILVSLYTKLIPASSISEPGKTAPQIVEALRKAGIKELPTTDVPDQQRHRAANERSDPGTFRNSEIPTPLTARIEGKAPATPISTSRKSVSFAEDVKEEDVPSPKPSATSETHKPSEVYNADTHSVKPDKIPRDQRPNITLYDKDEDKQFEAVVPENESPEDATLRRQMIDYNLGEVGAIVAELDLDEDDTPYSDDESGSIDEDTTSVEEDEDDFGRTKRRVLSDEYLAEMQQLEKRLTNIGPEAAVGVSPADRNSRTEQPAANGADLENTGPVQQPNTKKAVRFANELDVQEAPARGPSKVPPSGSPSTRTPEPTSVPRKPIHVPTVIERPPSTTADPSANSEPDDLDPTLVHQEVSTAYHRMRNSMIQQQGGFTNRDDEDESGAVPLTEAEGGPKKMSRFKAARLGKLGN